MGGNIIAKLKQAYSAAEKTAKKDTVSKQDEVVRHQADIDTYNLTLTLIGRHQADIDTYNLTLTLIGPRQISTHTT